MDLMLIRFSHGDDDTLGLLFDISVKPVFLAFTLEDEFRAIKEPGNTRIPEGRYRLKLRRYGEHHQQYREKFGSLHQGMIEIEGVPGFTDILFHIGNDHKDTAGCVLVGNSVQSNQHCEGWLGRSRDGYRRVYVYITGALLRGEDVYLSVTTIEKEIMSE